MNLLGLWFLPLGLFLLLLRSALDDAFHQPSAALRGLELFPVDSFGSCGLWCLPWVRVVPVCCVLLDLAVLRA